MLNSIGIYGWREHEENLFFASVLTGDPLLIIGDAGTAKTALVNLFSESMGLKFGFYDAAKSLFEDVIGFPNPSALKSGKMEYIQSPITIWDKEIILIDELNRAAREMQSKWLEIIRSRKIMGLSTNVRNVVAAMNPFTYSATNSLDEALIGRFASFIYAPDIMQMDEEDVKKIATNILTDDAPALANWGVPAPVSVSKEMLTKNGEEFRKLLNKAGEYYVQLQEQTKTMPKFLARLVKTISKQSDDKIKIDGRRLGFIYRTIVAVRAIELAKVSLYGTEQQDIVESAREVILSCVPIGLGQGSMDKDKAIHCIVTSFQQLSDYFKKDYDARVLDIIYELFTTPDIIKRASILFKNDLGTFITTNAWKAIIEKANESDIALVAYAAMQIEILHPNKIPKEFMSVLAKKIDIAKISDISLQGLNEQQLDFAQEMVSAFDDYDNNIKKLIAFKYAKEILNGQVITVEKITSAKSVINKKVEEFYQCLI